MALNTPEGTEKTGPLTLDEAATKLEGLLSDSEPAPEEPLEQAEEEESDVLEAEEEGVGCKDHAGTCRRKGWRHGHTEDRHYDRQRRVHVFDG